MPYKKRLSVRKHKVNYPNCGNKTSTENNQQEDGEKDDVAALVVAWNKCGSYAQSLGYTIITPPEGTLINYSIVTPSTEGATSKYNEFK